MQGKGPGTGKSGVFLLVKCFGTSFPSCTTQYQQEDVASSSCQDISIALANSTSQSKVDDMEVDVDDGFEEEKEEVNHEEVDKLSEQLAVELHAQLNNLRPRRK